MKAFTPPAASTSLFCLQPRIATSLSPRGRCLAAYAAPLLRLLPVFAMSFRGFPCARLHGLRKCFTKRYHTSL